MNDYADKIKEYFEETFKDEGLNVDTMVVRNKVILEVSTSKRSFTYMLQYTTDAKQFDTIMLNIVNDIRGKI